MASAVETDFGISIIRQLVVAVAGKDLRNAGAAGGSGRSGCCWRCLVSPSRTRAEGLIARIVGACYLRLPGPLAGVGLHQSRRSCAVLLGSVTTVKSETSQSAHLVQLGKPEISSLSDVSSH